MATNNFVKFTTKVACAAVAVSISLGIAQLLSYNMAHSGAVSNTVLASQAKVQKQGANATARTSVVNGTVTTPRERLGLRKS